MANGNGKERELGAMAEKLNAIHDDIREIKEDVKEQNGRVRKLENWRSGIVAVFGFIVLVAGLLKVFLK
jgi:uncharacterized membrane protein